MLRKYSLDKKITTPIKEESEAVVASLEEDHREYLQWLQRKRETKKALENAETEVRELHAKRMELQHKFWHAYEEHDEDALAHLESESKRLDREMKRAKKVLRKALSDFRKADFDEVIDSFVLKARADLAEREADSWAEEIKKSAREAFAEVQREVAKVAQDLRSEYEDPTFRTTEEREQHQRRMLEVENAIRKRYTRQLAKIVDPRLLPDKEQEENASPSEG
jgi:hypothetical protein